MQIRIGDVDPVLPELPAWETDLVARAWFEAHKRAHDQGMQCNLGHFQVAYRQVRANPITLPIGEQRAYESGLSDGIQVGKLAAAVPSFDETKPPYVKQIIHDRTGETQSIEVVLDNGMTFHSNGPVEFRIIQDPPHSLDCPCARCVTRRVNMTWG